MKLDRLLLWLLTAGLLGVLTIYGLTWAIAWNSFEVTIVLPHPEGR